MHIKCITKYIYMHCICIDYTSYSHIGSHV